MEVTKMGKIRFITAVSKCLAYITWTVSNVIRLTKKTGGRIIDNLNFNKRYRVEIFKGSEQLEVKQDINHKQLLNIIDTLDIMDDMSIIISKSNVFRAKAKESI